MTPCAHSHSTRSGVLWPVAGWNRVRILVVPPRMYLRLRRRSPSRMPRHTRMRHGLKGTGLVLAPDREPKLGAERVGLLNQLFLAIASGSLTRTTPCLRLRITTPVSHQVRLFCQLRPPACKVRQIV